MTCTRPSAMPLRKKGFADAVRRFGVSTREYKYFLLLDGGEDLEAMRAGAALFVGEHDFRNFCKVPD